MPVVGRRTCIYGVRHSAAASEQNINRIAEGPINQPAVPYRHRDPFSTGGLGLPLSLSLAHKAAPAYSSTSSRLLTTLSRFLGFLGLPASFTFLPSSSS